MKCLNCARRVYAGKVPLPCGCREEETLLERIRRSVAKYAKEYDEKNPPEPIVPSKKQIQIDAQKLTPAKRRALRHRIHFTSPHKEAGIDARRYQT